MKNDKIFIALNHSQLPNAITTYGSNLAKRLDRPAIVYGVATVPIISNPNSIVGATIPNPNINDAQTATEKKIESFIEEALNIYPHITYTVDSGDSIENIINKTDKENPYLVLVEGNSELTTLHEWFGTYETQLAEEITAPVLVLPESYFWKDVSSILYVMDIEDQKLDNILLLNKIAKDLNAKVNIVMISEKENKEEKLKHSQIISFLEESLGYKNVTFHQIFTQNSTDDVVEQLVENVNADWLAIEHQSSSFLERVFNGDNSERLILQSKIPVLVF